MTQRQLADKLGVTDKAVSKWERDLSYPDVVLFPKLVDVLGTTVDGLLRECGEGNQPSKLVHAFALSRDIRLPLHIILGCVEILKNNHDDPEIFRKYLEGIRISGEYMMYLFDQIMKGKERGSSAEAHPYIAEYLEEYLKDGISRKEVQSEAYRFSGKRILVAEDMQINREIAAEILKQTGADVEFAENGQICLEKVEKAPGGYYDMILMDIMMPEMDGLEATRRIRALKDPEKSAIPVIAMTTNVSAADRKAALDAGMDSFQEKPIFTDKLYRTMQQYLKI